MTSNILRILWILPPLAMLSLFINGSLKTAHKDRKEMEKITIPHNSSNKNDQVSNLSVARGKTDILAYFDRLIANEQIIVGQHCGNWPDAIRSYYNTHVDVLADLTGRHAGIIGADLGFFPSGTYPVKTLIDHWEQGGLVAVSWHADNPFIEGYDTYWNTVKNKGKIDLKSLLKDAPKTKAWVSYRVELDKVAGALQKLRDAGVTVMWRPFHEMNGDFFWWGIDAYNNQQTNEEDFKALWIDLYQTLTYDYGLDNLIWTYSVIPDRGWNADVSAYYPGSDYVDLVGMDYYGAAPDFPDYKALKSLGKTIVVSESGPMDQGNGNWNMMDLINTLKGKAAYFLQWHSGRDTKMAIRDNRNIFEMMNSKAAITRDELMPISF
ncbi:glycosyl hydrolase [Ulvibacterium sp.]|uniref:glycosyl hydrolase n=1 Tax=Ulvibacterium sp. TaxID=2665914 RepID=UPI003BAD354C